MDVTSFDMERRPGSERSIFLKIAGRFGKMSPTIRRVLLADPFSLTPGFCGPEQPDTEEPKFDEALDVRLTPYMRRASREYTTTSCIWRL
jgi:hypothetical protein